MRLINKSLSSFSQYPKNLDLSSDNTFYVPLLPYSQSKDLVKNINPNR